MVDGRVWSGGGGLCGCSADHPMRRSGRHLTSSIRTVRRPRGRSSTRHPAKSLQRFDITVRGTAGYDEFLARQDVVRDAQQQQRHALSHCSVVQETVAGEYTVTLHSNSNVLTPGFWMLFGLERAGRAVGCKSDPGVDPWPRRVRRCCETSTGLTHAKNTAIDMTLHVIEPDGDPLIFSATGLPPGITLGAQSGRLNGMLTYVREPIAVTISCRWRARQRHDELHVASARQSRLVYEYYHGSSTCCPNFDC